MKNFAESRKTGSALRFVHNRNMARFRWVLLSFAVVLLNAQRAPSPAFLPTELDRGAAGMTRWLHALGTRASLIMITAHPDDEDGGMLAMQTRGLGARGVLMT